MTAAPAGLSGAIVEPRTNGQTPRRFPLLTLAAESLDDVEGIRIATANRIRAMQDDLGLAEGDPALRRIQLTLGALTEAEKNAEAQLKQSLAEAGEICRWVKDTHGLGEKTIARLLGVIGHPRWRFDNETEEWLPRTIGQLRSYCGYGDAATQRRRKGEQGNWNSKARTRTWIVADRLITKPDSPYRAVYDEGRKRYEDAVHEAPCPQCGPKGKPAPAGSPLSDGHKHARARRLVAKQVLKDLWLAAG